MERKRNPTSVSEFQLACAGDAGHDMQVVLSREAEIAQRQSSIGKYAPSTVCPLGA
jgi:hypothetical protein